MKKCCEDVSSGKNRHGVNRTSSKVDKLDLFEVWKWSEIFVFSRGHNILGNVLRTWSAVNTGD